jgi:branched-chain amino acid transport system permease protein
LFGYQLGTDPRAFPVLAIVLAVVIAATMYLTSSKLGRALCAIRDSEHAAAASGIDVRTTKIAVFAISACYAGIAGGMFTMYQSFMNPASFGFAQIVLVLSMIVVGGLGTLPGTLIGVVILGLLPEVMRTAMRSLLIWQELVYGLILVLAMMYMPRGLWGLWTSKRTGS